MADNEGDRSSEDLTEEASSHRLEEFRSKGQVAQSRELTGLVTFGGCAIAAYALSPSMGGQLVEFMREVFTNDLSAKADLATAAGAGRVLVKSVRLMAVIGLPVSFVGFVIGVVSSFAQVGTIFTLETLTPDFAKVDPLKGLQRMFSMKTGVEGLRLFFKISIVTAVAYGALKREVLASPALLVTDPMALFAAYGGAAKAVFFPVMAVLAVFAGLDLWKQRYDYNKQLRMTKQEAKQEHKEREGDPHTKARIRSIQRDMARKRMMHAVRTADVIITNPTHFAIALKYDKEKMAAPKVVAKGADFLAQKIKALGAEAGIPLVENVPLARTLFKSVKINQAIPRNLYQAVAEVLAYVYRLKNGRF